MSKVWRDNPNAAKYFSIGATIIVGIVALLTYTSIIPNDINRFFKVGDSWTRYLGLVCFGAILWLTYGSSKVALPEKAGATYWALVFGLFVLGIAFAGQFNFDYFRLR